MISTLLWNPHLGTLANSLIVLVMMGWLRLLYSRYRSLHSVKRSWLLMIPKILFTLLVLIALFDPSWRVASSMRDAEVVLLTDVSSSMNVKDGDAGTRAERANRIAKKFKDELGDSVKFRTLPFDVDIQDPEKKFGDEIRGTDIGRTIVSLSQRPDLAACKAVVMVTDGGDEVVDSERMPGASIYIAGVGTDPSTWNDVAIDQVVVPTEIEVNSPFKVSGDIIGRGAHGDFSLKLAAVEVALEKSVDGKFQTVDSQTVDLRSQKAPVEFQVAAEATEGIREYRLNVKPIANELSDLNNQRTFQVNMRQKKIHVLLYGRVLDWNYAMIRRELDDDPMIGLTAVYHKNSDVIRIEGSRQEGDEVLSRGFPIDKAVLGLYKCIILGSFPSKHLPTACYEALKEYVEGGGSVIFLGGRDSFGKGEYAGTPIAPLMPWQISADEREISAGQYPVVVSPEGEEHSVMSATASILKDVNSPVLYSINHVGRLRSGAVSLMNTSVGAESVAVVALQSYRKGQTLGLATDTLWRWGRMQGKIADTYGQFWRDATRFMCGGFEGGRFLTVRWNRDRYRPSEQAVADIKVAGRYSAGEIRLQGTMKHADKSQELVLDPVSGEDNMYRTKVFFPERGDYAIDLEAKKGDEVIDKYQRTIHVGSSLNEGAQLVVDHAYLENLTGRSGGSYAPEKTVDQLIERLKDNLMAAASPQDLPLVRKPDLLHHTLPVYVLLAMLVLVGEWVMRRRMNMM
ncbi:MAG: glutamine amidotransferase [Verrucomicrobia bacterium]|nr:glutamine amidotransferase [Verrucomicrobiota bacterium]